MAVPWILVVALALAAALLVWWRRREGFEDEEPKGVPAVTEPLRPSRFKSHGRTHYFQMPPKQPRGLLVVMPGCARWGPGFWPHDKRECPECAGLTEDVCHTAQALARGYAILVAWPVDRAFPGQYCWSAKDDFPSLVEVLRAFVKSQPGLKDKPIYAMGASSGGSVALRLPGKAAAAGLRISGVLAEVATKLEVPDIVRELRGGQYPPIVWVTMGANPTEIQRGRQRAREYRKYGPAADVTSAPKPITPSYFADRHPRITAQQSADLVEGLKRAGVLRQDGTFATDPKKNKAWPAKLRREVPWLAGADQAVFALAPTKKSAILQAMLVAQANHEHVCDYLTAALAWFEEDGRPAFEGMVARHGVDKPSRLSVVAPPGPPAEKIEA